MALAGVGILSEQWAYTTKTWDRITEPLKPGAADLAVICGQLLLLAERFDRLNALVLGVTKDYLDLPWPTGSNIRGLDNASVMIRNHWSGESGTAVQGDWCQMPLQSESQHIVLLDAGLCLLGWPDEQKQVLEEVARILVPDGMFIVRLLVLPHETESMPAVVQAVRAGEITDLSLLRIRLWMAMQADGIFPVTNRQFWTLLASSFPDLDELAQFCSTDSAYLQEALSKLQAEPVRNFAFAALEDYVHMIDSMDGQFSVTEKFIPEYHLGERCPTLVLRKNAA